MPRANPAHSVCAPAPSCGIDRKPTGVASRRAVISFAAATMAVPAMGAITPSWSAIDWIERWHDLGCGLDVRRNALELRGRLNGDRVAIGAMMAELVLPDRQAAVITAYERSTAWRSAGKTPTIAALDAHAAAASRFEALPDDLARSDPARFRSEEALLSASHARCLRQTPTNWNDFTAMLAFITGDGATGIAPDIATALLSNAKRLAGH